MSSSSSFVSLIQIECFAPLESASPSLSQTPKVDCCFSFSGILPKAPTQSWLREKHYWFPCLLASPPSSTCPSLDGLKNKVAKFFRTVQKRLGKSISEPVDLIFNSLTQWSLFLFCLFLFCFGVFFGRKGQTRKFLFNQWCKSMKTVINKTATTV